MYRAGDRINRPAQRVSNALSRINRPVERVHKAVTRNTRPLKRIFNDLLGSVDQFKQYTRL